MDDVPGHPVDYLTWPALRWPDAPQPARPVAAAVLAMDRLTHEDLSTGTVHLSRRAVHVGVWLRLLRTLLDEVAAGSTRLAVSKADELRRIWRETGHPFRAWSPARLADSSALSSSGRRASFPEALSTNT